MATYLVVKSGNQTKSYTAKTTADKPYMRVGTGYFPLTSETTTASGLRLKLDNKPYRIVETYYTTISTTTSTEYATTRSSQYDTESYSTEYYQTTTTGQSVSQSMVYVPLNVSTVSAYQEPPIITTYVDVNRSLIIARKGSTGGAKNSYTIRIAPLDNYIEASGTISVSFSNGGVFKTFDTVKASGTTNLSVSSIRNIGSAQTNSLRTMYVSLTQVMSQTYEMGVYSSNIGTQQIASNVGYIGAYNATFYSSTVTSNTYYGGYASTGKTSGIYLANTLSVAGYATTKTLTLNDSLSAVRRTQSWNDVFYTLLYSSAQYLQTGTYTVPVDTQSSSLATVTYTTSRQSDYTTTSEVETTSQVTTQ